jgi:hypothetical protein
MNGAVHPAIFLCSKRKKNNIKTTLSLKKIKLAK